MYSTDQLRDYSAIFSRSEILRLLDNNFDSINAKINRYTLGKSFKGANYLKFFKKIYSILEKHYPNEYIYKNQFLNTWLKKELGNHGSIIFNELRLGKSIADLAMFNGISKVFEIKTILDKECRLLSQLDTYKKIFNEVYIIIPISLLSKYEVYDPSVGIITYDDNEFVLKREAGRNRIIDFEQLMEILHTHEYKQIVNGYYQELPEMDAFNQFELCKILISKIPHEELNELFLSVIKQRKYNNNFFLGDNTEFNQICLSLNLNKKQIQSLMDNLNTTITQLN